MVAKNGQLVKYEPRKNDPKKEVVDTEDTHIDTGNTDPSPANFKLEDIYEFLSLKAEILKFIEDNHISNG